MNQLPEGFVLDEDKISMLPEGFVLDSPENQGIIQKRLGMAQEAIARGQRGEQSLGATIGQVALKGAGGTATDFISKLLTPPEAYKQKMQQAMQPAMQTETGQAIEGGIQKAGQFIGENIAQPAQEWYSKQSPSTQANIDSAAILANLLTAGTLGATKAGKEVIGGVRAAPRLTSDVGKLLEKSVDAEKAAQYQKMVMPVFTKKEAEQAAARSGRTKITGKIFKDVETVPYPSEILAAEEAAKIKGVKPGNAISNILTNRPQQNINLINQEIGKKATSLKSALEKDNVSLLSPQRIETPTKIDEFGNKITGNPVVIPSRNKFHDIIDDAVKEIDSNATLTGDARARFDAMAQKMREFVDKNPPTTAGLLQARKEFDAWIESSKPNIFNQAREEAVSYANKIMRRKANDFIAEMSPSVSVKKSLAEQSALYDAIENLAPKAIKAGATTGERLKNMANLNTLKDITGAGILGGLAIGTGTTIPAVLGYGAYKAVTSQTARKALGKALQLPEDVLRQLSKLSPAEAKKVFEQLKKGKKQ